MPSFQPYWGKPAVRNDRGDRGDVGIIRSPVRASILPDQFLDYRQADRINPAPAIIHGDDGGARRQPAHIQRLYRLAQWQYRITVALQILYPAAEQLLSYKQRASVLVFFCYGKAVVAYDAQSVSGGVPCVAKEPKKFHNCQRKSDGHARYRHLSREKAESVCHRQPQSQKLVSHAAPILADEVAQLDRCRHRHPLRANRAAGERNFLSRSDSMTLFTTPG